MSKKRLAFVIAVLLGVLSSAAQQRSVDMKNSFEDFRKGLYNEYNSFRDGILADYAKFLDGVWVEYNGFKAQERNSAPKPKQAPVAKPDSQKEDEVAKQPKPAPAPAPKPKKDEELAKAPKPKPEDVKKETPKTQPAPAPAPKPKKDEELAKAPKPKPEDVKKETPKTQPAPAPTPKPKKDEELAKAPKPKPEDLKKETPKTQPAPAPAPKPKKDEELAKAPKPKPEDVKKETPKTQPAPAPAPKPKKDEELAQAPKPVDVKKEEPAAPVKKGFSFDYRGIELNLPEVDIKLMDKLSAPADFASQWRSLDENPETGKLVEAIEGLAKELNFNGYLTYDLATEYARSRFATAAPTVRTSLVHYIMTHLGYDARIGVDVSGQALIMIPSKQTIYGHIYFRFGDEKYYAFTDPDVKLSPADMRVSTCELPAAASKASKFDMRLGELKIPYSPQPYSVKFGDMEIHGETNAKLYPILYKYPQMPIGDYAQSVLMPGLRKDIVQQLKNQLTGKQRRDAVNTLLRFVQSGFEYATDDEMHGFEKPYFFEEVLYYPKCDCEDRVIFYTYLLWNVLGVENHLISYPGHESAAVALDGVRGDAYNYSGQTFYISDPTFIGAKTGMCMPEYTTVSPEIDHIYK